MRIAYFNDRKSDARIYVDNLHTESCAAILRPAELGIIDIGNAPSKEHYPFIKVWETNMVLISWVPEQPYYGEEA